MMKEKKKDIIRLPEKLGFMSFSASSNIVYNFRSLYYLIFLTNVLKIPMMTAGTMMVLGTVWDAVNDPIVGYWTANIRFKNGETVRPYLIIASIPWAAGMVLMFTDFNLPQTATIVIAMLIYFFYELANTFVGVPYNAMGNLASSNDSDRKSINAFRSLGGCLGSGIGAVLVTPLVKLFGGLKESNAIISSSDALPLFKTALFMGILMIAGSLLHYFTTRERVKPKEDDEEEEKIGIVAMYKMLFKCKSWIANMFYILCYGVSNTLIMSMISYYASYVLGGSAKATPILAVYLLVSIIVSMLTPSIDNKLGRKKTMYFGALIQIVTKIPFVINPYSLINIYINAAGLGVGATITFVMFNTNRNNISDVVEVENGRRLDTMIANGDNLAAKLAQALVSQGMTFAMAKAGFDQSLQMNQPTSVIHTICALIGWVPMIVVGFMLIAIHFINIKKEMEQAQKEAKA